MPERNSTRAPRTINSSLPGEIQGQLKTWLLSLQHSWRSAVTIDRSQLTFSLALRNALGIALPLIVGVLTGHIIVGVSLAGGAASLGSVGLTLTYHARMRLMLLASIGIAVSALVGSLTGDIGWLAILIAGIWGFGAGMLVSIGTGAMIFGLQSTVALIILSHFSLSPRQAILQALLMFGGALLQTGLNLIPLPGYHANPERATLSKVYQALADRAADPLQPPTGQKVGAALTKAEDILNDSHSDTPRNKAFADLLNYSERIHLTLIVLVQILAYFTRHHEDTRQASVEQPLRQAFHASTLILRAVADSLRTPGRFVPLTEPMQQLQQCISRLRQQSKAADAQEITKVALIYCETLRQELLAVEKIAQTWSETRGHVRFSRPRRPHFQLRDPLETLRTNLTLRSSACRHAIRLGVTLALATACYHIFPLPRGYWIPLTVLLVLKPDFTATFSRGFARFIGTFIGAVLTTLLVSHLPLTPPVLILLVTFTAFFSFAFLNANYALFSFFLTGEVVFLLAFIDHQPLADTAGRALDTLIGGSLALLSYLLWPTWEHTQAHVVIARHIEALNSYVHAVLRVYIQPADYNAHLLYSSRKEARLTRSNAQASLERLQQEPVHDRLTPDVARGLFTSSDTLAISALTLDAYLQDTSLRRPFPALTPFSQDTETSLDALAAMLYHEQAHDLPSIHKQLHTLKCVQKKVQGSAKADTRFVYHEACTIATCIDTMSHLLATTYTTESPH